jgi:hypothetical protein
MTPERMVITVRRKNFAPALQAAIILHCNNCRDAPKAYSSKGEQSPPNEPQRWVNSMRSGLGKTMASDDKKIKTDPAPKKEAPAKDKSTAVDTSKAEGGKAAEGGKPAEDGKPAEGGKPADAVPYSRGEGQKPVSQAYRDNWNAIFAKKKKR